MALTDPIERRLTATLLVVVVLGASQMLVGASIPSSALAARPVLVGLFGDSLSVQAQPYFNFLIQAGGRATVSDFAYGGTAACDWLPDMQRFARADHPRAVVIEFVGNTFSPCMLGCSSGSRTAVHLYCSAIEQAIEAFLAVGTHVFLIGTPITRTEWLNHDRNWNDLNSAFAALAGKHRKRVTYVDAGTSVEGAHHSFVPTLPCLWFEPCTGPTTAGVKSNIVRSPDGVHFCPVSVGNARGQVSRCPVYSSGAFRFAAAMAGPVISQLHLAGSRQRSGPAGYV